MTGTVIDVQVFTRDGVKRDKRAESIIEDALKRYRRDLDDQLRIVERDAFDRLRRQLVGHKVAGGPDAFKPGVALTMEMLEAVPGYDLFNLRMEEEGAQHIIDLTMRAIQDTREQNDRKYATKKDKLTRGDELPPGVLKMVKVYIAERRRLQPGDKMAGRHGNKGVVSKICPVEDMPYMADGRPADIVLNPLGVPSRMNIGQVLEVHLGWAAKGLGWRIEEMLKTEQVRQIRAFLNEVYNRTGKKEDLDSLTDDELMAMARNLRNGVPFATPVFDGATEEQVRMMLDLAFPDDEAARLQLTPAKTQARLYDGRTGEAFERPVTVGFMHYLKLHHLVDDKMHARSTGPYSSSPSSRSAARRSSAASASVKWKSGPSKPTAPPTCCRKCLLSSLTTLTVVPRFTKTSSRVTTRLKRACPNPSTCWSRKSGRWVSTSTSSRTKGKLSDENAA